MQLLADGRDKVIASYAYSNRQTNEDHHLFELASGAFQWGSGREAKIVQSVEEVKMFHPTLVARVAQWLARNGPRLAYQDKVSADIQEQAHAQMGSVDARLAVLETANPGLRADILRLLDQKLVSLGLVPNPTSASPEEDPTATRRAHLRELNAKEQHLLAKSGKMIPGQQPKAFDPDGLDLDTDAPDLSPGMDRAGAMARLQQEMASGLDEDDHVSASVLGADFPVPAETAAR